ncbi:hypothetical protein D3C72_2459500 [compost metagenome]
MTNSALVVGSAARALLVCVLDEATMPVPAKPQPLSDRISVERASAVNSCFFIGYLEEGMGATLLIPGFGSNLANEF